MDHNEYEENGGRWLRRRPGAHHFLDIGYGLSVAYAVGCTWLMYSLCMAQIWPMHDLRMAHIAFRSAISSAISSAPRTDHQGILAGKKGV